MNHQLQQGLDWARCVALILPVLVSCAQAGTAAEPAALGSAGMQARPVSAPLVIRQGGTYTGNWESKDPAVPAVSVETTEPVLIQRCHLTGTGDLIRSLVQGSQIAVTDCYAHGQTPLRSGLPHGRFVAVYRPAQLIVTNNELVSTAGIYVDGGGYSARKISIQRNRARNIEGRLSDGRGGLGTEAPPVQFVQINNLRRAADVTVSWNEVVNEPSRSRVEDVISIHSSSGLPSHPIRITNNFLHGAYPARPEFDNFSGGGIIVEGAALGRDDPSGYVDIEGNQVLETTNYGIAIAAGVGVSITRNRVLATGRLPNGHQLAAANVGLYVWDILRERARGSPFHSHRVWQNLVAWWNKDSQRNDYWFPDCAPTACSSNISQSIQRDASLLDVEKKYWLEQTRRTGLTIGPRE